MTVELTADWPVLVISALLIAGVLGAGFADRLRVPGLLLFLGLGMLIADDGLGLFTLDDPQVAQIGGTVALILILYEGGLTTKPRDLREAAGPGLVLATVAVALTAAITAAGTYLVLDVEPLTAMLIGSVVASTDAAAVFAMLRRAPLPRRLSALLEVESGTNDPMAIMLTVGLLEAWRADPTAVEWVAFGVVQLGGGLLTGAVLGVGGSWLLSRVRLGPAGLYPVLALGLAGLTYGTAAQIGASGFLAVYIAGLLVGARVPLHRRNIRTFHDGLANTAEIGLFLLLGMLVFPTELPAVILPGLGVAAVLMVLARPLAVLACLAGFRYSWRELSLIAWVGLRGAVPIVLATFPFAAGHPDGELVFNIIFFVVLLSAALQGTTIAPAAGRLGLRQPAPPWSAVAEALPLDSTSSELVEVHVTEDLYIAGKQLSDVPPPAGLVAAIMRGQQVLEPTVRTRLRVGDIVIVALPLHPEATRRVTAWARGEPDPTDAG